MEDTSVLLASVDAGLTPWFRGWALPGCATEPDFGTGGFAAEPRRGLSICFVESDLETLAFAGAEAGLGATGCFSVETPGGAGGFMVDLGLGTPAGLLSAADCAAASRFGANPVLSDSLGAEVCLAARGGGLGVAGRMRSESGPGKTFRFGVAPPGLGGAGGFGMDPLAAADSFGVALPGFAVTGGFGLELPGLKWENWLGAELAELRAADALAVEPAVVACACLGVAGHGPRSRPGAEVLPIRGRLLGCSSSCTQDG